MAARRSYSHLRYEMDIVTSRKPKPCKQPWVAVEPLLPDVKRGLDDIAAMLQQEDVKEFLIVRDLRHLSERYGHSQPFQKWRHSSTDLNLLQFAVLHRRSGVVEYLLDKHRELLELDLYVKQTGARRSLYELYTWYLMSEDIETCIKLYKNVVNHPLHMACWLGDLDCLKALIQVDPQTWEANRATKMQFVAWMKSTSWITRAVTGPLHSQIKARPLDLAVENASISCLRFLLGKILPLVNYPFSLLPEKVKGTELSLHTACSLGCPKLVAVLLAAQPQDVHCRDDEGQTPLHLAVRCGYTDIIRLLLEHKADVSGLVVPVPSGFLFRGNEPHTLMVNAKQFNNGAYLDQISNRNRILTPLHLLVDMIVKTGAICRFSYELMDLDATRRLANYTESDAKARADWSMENYLQNLVSCLRLLLTAGANPKEKNGGRNMLEVVMNTPAYPGSPPTENPRFLLTVVSSLVEFGATLTLRNLDSLIHFLRCHVCTMKCSTTQASFIQLLCENGIDPDCIARRLASSLPCDSPLWNRSLPFWTCLAQRMSVEAFSTLSGFHHHQFPYRRLNKLRSTSVKSPRRSCKATAMWKAQGLRNCKVRPLMHFCKVAVWKGLGHQGGGIASLPVPEKVKAYLKVDQL